MTIAAKALVVAAWVGGLGALSYAQGFSTLLLAAAAASLGAAAAGLVTRRVEFLDLGLLAAFVGAAAPPGSGVLHPAAVGLGAFLLIGGHQVGAFVLRHGMNEPGTRPPVWFVLPRITVTAAVAATVATLLPELPRLLATQVSPRWGSSLESQSPILGIVIAATILLGAFGLTFARFVVRGRADQTKESTGAEAVTNARDA